MKFKSQVLTQASGSIGGITYSHNRGGMYTRARAIPTNPNSPQQQAVKAILANLAVVWTNTLNVAQRAAWDLYAANVPIIDVLGSPIFLTGLNMFVRSNVPRVQAGMVQVTVAPPNFNVGSFTNPSATASAATQQISLVFTNTDTWAVAVGGAMLLAASRPQQAAINYFKGPYRFAGKVLGAVIPPTSPQTIPVPFAVLQGQRLFLKVNVVQVDGRLSYPFRTTLICGA
jgi:hypothetical protein